MGKEKRNKEKKKVKEEFETLPDINKPKTNRNNLTLQHFMNDMMLVGDQTRQPDLEKPSSFNYGDLTVTNYLLWLILAELMILNGEKV